MKKSITLVLMAALFTPAIVFSAGCPSGINDLLEDYDDAYRGTVSYSRIHNSVIDTATHIDLERRGELARSKATSQTGKSEGEWNLLMNSKEKEIAKLIKKSPSCKKDEFEKLFQKYAPYAVSQSLNGSYVYRGW